MMMMMMVAGGQTKGSQRTCLYHICDLYHKKQDRLMIIISNFLFHYNAVQFHNNLVVIVKKVQKINYSLNTTRQKPRTTDTGTEFLWETLAWRLRELASEKMLRKLAHHLLGEWGIHHHGVPQSHIQKTTQTFRWARPRPGTLKVVS